MEDMSADDMRTVAIELGKLLSEHKGGDVRVLDMRCFNFWTDFFIITTVTSSTHQQGLQRYVKDFATDRSLEILRRHRKISEDDEWSLIDMGSLVIHLMTKASREFYDLERLWNGADILWQG